MGATQRKDETPMLGGRPRLDVDYGLVLALRQGDDVGHPRGWLSVAAEYRRRTGQFISKQTAKRRFLEVMR